ncbi:helix-turn-helix domain-containing protein [Candidatus Micrarchaeota archaeon]|nr:helix-turn-helix domain-containing protein [Candidatus Micrarchaeota archaeon]
MPKARPLIIELEVSHPCMNIHALDKMREEEARTIMRGITGVSKNKVSHIFTFKSSNPKKLIELHKKAPFVKQMEIVSLSKDSADVLMATEADVGISHALAKSKCFSLEPVVTHHGVDNVLLFAPSFSAFREFLEMLPDDFEIKIKRKRYITDGVSAGFSTFSSVGFLELKAASELLSEKQREIFNLAVSKGYYEVPKKLTIRELAGITGIKASTLQEHLSKAESKLLPILARILKNI